MHSRRVLSFFFANRTGAPHGEVLSLINPLPSNSYIWTLSSCNSTGAILCGAIEMGDVPGCSSMRKSTSLEEGNSGSSSRKTSFYSHTARGRSKSCLTSSSRVIHGLGQSIVLVSLKRDISTILNVGGNSPTLTINNDSMCR